MYNRICKIFNEKQLTCSLQFHFWQIYSTVHALLISLTKIIIKSLDEGSIGCGIFNGLQKAFDTV